MKHSHSHTFAFMAATLASLTAACSGGSDDESTSFVIGSTNVATSLSTPIRTSGAYIAFLAAEDTTGSGTDLNGDGVPNDLVAHVVNTVTGGQFRLGVAATDLAWAGSELYIVVDEALDGRDWNNDVALTDDVLLHWSETTAELEYVDDLATNASVSVIALGERILYASKTATAGVGGSNLRFVESSAPLVPIPVATTDTVGPLDATLLREDEGLVFVTFDEVAAVRDLNDDADDDDTDVLALLDGTDNASVVRSTELAVDPASPLRAKSIATGDWRVGFLVSEAAQGAVSLNSSTAIGPNFRACVANDVDTTDQVLAVLTYSTFEADPVANRPVNHGFPGRDRIAFAGSYVATIVSEAADNCDLNNDGDTTDTVVRWVAIADDELDSIIPVNNSANRAENRPLFVAPGGGFGLYELSNRFVIVASEANGGDIDVNDLLDANLVAWLQPSGTSTVWDYFHGTTGTQVAEASWVAARESGNTLGLAFTERIGGTSLNQSDATGTGDNDTIDSIPTFASFSSGRLVFPGILVALDQDAAGIVVANGWGFYRISEPEDSRDRNFDGDETDFILQRTNLTSGLSNGMSVVPATDRDIVEFARFGSKSCGAMLAIESAQGAGGTDFNGDGDRTDLVLRWFSF